MRYACFIIVVLFPCFAFGQTTIPSGQPLKATLLDGLGDHHHPVSTTNAEAQKYFDQGMALLFAFNHDEAMRSFMRAGELDPKLAMAHWGVAMALGPNYNVDVDPPREKAAAEAIQKAIQLASAAPGPERDYIDALAKRYSADPKADLKKLAADYSKAMAELSRKYPDDLDAANFYAESLMLLNPWKLWTRDGKPGPDTLTIVAVLESILKRYPDHIGANHLYIHAIEASPNPERALESAARLPGLAPAAGHLVHMPAHIYGRTGDHDAAAGSNSAAAAADRDYLKTRNDGGIYPMMYFSHNLHFLAYAHMLQGRYADALKASEQLVGNAGPHVQMMPMLEAFVVIPTVVQARFGKWDEILAMTEPKEGMVISRIEYRFARSLAQAAKGKPDEADKERKLMLEAAKPLPADAMFDPLNTAASVIALSDSYLAAQVALARNDVKGAIVILNKAVEQEDAQNYDEPPAWWFSVREVLGAALLKDNQPAEAEKVMRKELETSPRSGRALSILAKSLQAQGKAYDAGWVEQQFKVAWKNADTKLP